MAQFAPTRLTADPAERQRFLAVLRDTRSLKQAAQATGVSIATVGRLRARDPDFADACAAAVGDTSSAARALEAALLGRLTHGTERYRFYADGRVDVWCEYNDTLAYAVLKRLWPERHGEASAAAAAPVPTMSRAEFMAFVRAQPRLDPLDGGDGG